MLRGDYAAALPYADLALETYPEKEDAQELLGFLCLETKRYGEAVEALRPLAETEHGTLQPKYNLACAYAGLGSNETALVLLVEVARRDPRFVALAWRDPDMSMLRKDPRFAELFPRPNP